MELSLLRKSTPLFCPPYRPSSLPRPRIVACSLLFLTSCLLLHDFQSSLSPTTLPLKQQYHMLPLPPCHLMPPSTNPPLLLTISFHFMPPVCLVLQTLRTHHTMHLHLHSLLCRIQFLHILLSSHYQHSLSLIHQPLIVSHLHFFFRVRHLLISKILAKPSKP